MKWIRDTYDDKWLIGVPVPNMVEKTTTAGGNTWRFYYHPMNRAYNLTNRPPVELSQWELFKLVGPFHWLWLNME